MFFLSCLLFFVILYYYLTWHHDYWDKRGLVTARPLTLLGNYLSIFKPSEEIVNELTVIYNKYKYNHRAVGTYITRQPKMLVLDPQLAQEVLVKKFSCYRDALMSSFVHLEADKYVRCNPFWAAGDYWKNKRMEGQAGLTLNRLRQAYVIWRSKTQQLSSYLERYVIEKGQVIEAKDLCYRFTAAIMCDFIWGIDVGTLTQSPNEVNTVMKMATKWASFAFSRKERFFVTYLAPITRKLLQMRHFPQDTDDFFSQLTMDAIKLRLKMPKMQRIDYLNYLLELREVKHLSDDDLVGHAMTVMLNGYETTGDVLMRTLYYLAVTPEAQQKLRDEILANLGSEKFLEFEQLLGLTYMEHCIYESMRLTSSVSQYSKICTKPTTIQLSPGKQLCVEPGTVVMIPIYQIHRDERYFESPNDFMPERFSNGVLKEQLKSGVLMPFGNGPRMCMGRRVAALTMKSALLHIFATYVVTAHKPINSTFAGDILLDFKRL